MVSKGNNPIVYTTNVTQVQLAKSRKHPILSLLRNATQCVSPAQGRSLPLDLLGLSLRPWLFLSAGRRKFLRFLEFRAKNRLGPFLLPQYKVVMFHELLSNLSVSDHFGSLQMLVVTQSGIVVMPSLQTQLRTIFDLESKASIGHCTKTHKQIWWALLQTQPSYNNPNPQLLWICWGHLTRMLNTIEHFLSAKNPPKQCGNVNMV